MGDDRGLALNIVVTYTAATGLKHLVYRDAMPDPRSMLGVSDVEKIVADGEGEEVVGRRRSHQADVFTG